MKACPLFLYKNEKTELRIEIVQPATLFFVIRLKFQNPCPKYRLTYTKR